MPSDLSDLTFRSAPREPGADPVWDLLGDDWQRLDELLDDARVYVRTEPDQNGRRVIVGLHLDGTPVTSELLRSMPVGRIENLLNVEPMSADQFFNELAPLHRRRGMDPDEFAALVATYYRYFSQHSSRPVRMMADHAGVPLPTVHGWVREARLRGKLPKGQRGKATAGA